MNFKNVRTTPWKKCYSLLLASPAYYRMCSTDVYCLKQTGGGSTGNHRSRFLRFWNWAEENCRCSKICGGAENVVKTEAANIRKWIARFYYFRRLYSAGSAYCVLTIICMSCPSIWATLSALLINILLGSFQLFLHSDQPLSEGEIIPIQRCLPVGGLHYPRRRRWALRTDWWLLMCNRRRPAATSSHRHRFRFNIN